MLEVFLPPLLRFEGGWFAAFHPELSVPLQTLVNSNSNKIKGMVKEKKSLGLRLLLYFTVYGNYILFLHSNRNKDMVIFYQLSYITLVSKPENLIYRAKRF